jgi:hypothetical protein
VVVDPAICGTSLQNLPVAALLISVGLPGSKGSVELG